MAKDQLDDFEARLRALFEEQVSGDDEAAPHAAAPKPGHAVKPDRPEVTEDFFTPLFQDEASTGNAGRPRREATKPAAGPEASQKGKSKKARFKGGSFTTLFQPQASKRNRASGGQESAPPGATSGPVKGGRLDQMRGRVRELFTNLQGLAASWRKSAEPAGRTAAPTPAPQPHEPTQRKQHRDFVWFFETLLRPLLLLGILGAAAHALYSYLFTHEEPPSLRPVRVEAMHSEPVVETPQEIPAQLPVEPDGEFAIQVAMCVLPTCVTEFRERLSQHDLAMQVEERSATQETVEVYSETAFATQDEAAAVADSINREFRMRDQVYVFSDSNVFHVSMGSFADLSRAESFTSVLNRRFQDRATFAPRIRSSSYMMNVIVAGSFASRPLAEAALARLIAADTAFAESYVVRR